MSTLTETEPLLHPSNTPHGINEDRTEPETESDRVIAPNRIWPVALFSLIACVGSVVVGMSVGYGDISEIYTLLRNTTHGDESESWTTSWFGVSHSLLALSHVSSSPVPRSFCDLMHEEGKKCMCLYLGISFRDVQIRPSVRNLHKNFTAI